MTDFLLQVTIFYVIMKAQGIVMKGTNFWHRVHKLTFHWCVTIHT